ncbi:hypothetical protein T07_10590 [Trichinella nelsoni]|uniref:Uncharacterized protein n=1 Tax=Trichinella nelsoni TaxID=6336 RepID=A0A0V0SJ99_9BILA|nr:hypothetical protein T07_10590 [Trichinella nelsoni]
MLRAALSGGLVRRPNMASITVIARGRRAGDYRRVRLRDHIFRLAAAVPAFPSSRFGGNTLASTRQMKSTILMTNINKERHRKSQESTNAIALLDINNRTAVILFRSSSIHLFTAASLFFLFVI